MPRLASPACLDDCRLLLLQFHLLLHQHTAHLTTHQPLSSSFLRYSSSSIHRLSLHPLYPPSSSSLLLFHLSQYEVLLLVRPSIRPVAVLPSSSTICPSGLRPLMLYVYFLCRRRSTPRPECSSGGSRPTENKKWTRSGRRTKTGWM